MATSQCFGLIVPTAAPHRAHRVDNIFRGETASGSSYSPARRQPALLPDDNLASFEDIGTSCAMDRAVHAASTHKRGVGGVHDGITGFKRNIARATDDKRTFRHDSDEDAEGFDGGGHAIE